MSGDAQAGKTLSASAFLASDWKQVIAQAGEKDCQYYFAPLYKHAEALASGGKAAEADTVVALARACHLALNPDDDEGPLVPMFTGEHGRTPAIDDFDDAELDLFSEVVEAIDEPELQARVGDILWLRRHDGAAARLAAGAYLSSCKASIHAKRTVGLERKLQRALDLAVQLGKTNEAFVEASSTLQEAVLSLAASGDSKLVLGILKALLRHRQGDPNVLAPLAERWAEEATGRGDWIWCQHWWSVAERYVAIAGNREEVDRVRRALARSFELQAAQESDQPGRAAMAAHWLQAAIGVLQTVGGTREERESLTKRMLELQREATSNMRAISHSMDVADILKTVEQQVTRQDAREAVIALASLREPTARTRLEEDTRDSIRTAPLLHLVGRTLVDREGRVLASSPPLSLTGDDSAGAAFRDRVLEKADSYQCFKAFLVRRAWQVITEQHDVPMGEMLSLTHVSQFVPPRREQTIARGLFVGFRGDFSTATHLLLPQIENALRWHLNNQGIVTITPDRDGVQKERNLDKLLAMPELETMLGADTVFDLRVLLVEPFGGNLRNLAAHGLLDDESLRDWRPLYFWWSMLRLCVLASLQECAQPERAVVDGGDTEPGDRDGGTEVQHIVEDTEAEEP